VSGFTVGVVVDSNMAYRDNVLSYLFPCFCTRSSSPIGKKEHIGNNRQTEQVSGCEYDFSPVNLQTSNLFVPNYIHMQEDINYSRIKASMEFIVANFRNQPGIGEIAHHVNLSEFHFQRIFREWAGVSPKKFLQYITLNELKNNIDSAGSLIELAEQAGLSSQSRVYDLFVNVESVTPHEYKTKGRGIAIKYGIHPSPFGKCLIAVTARGICGLEFIDGDEQEVMMRFSNKWANATLEEDRSETGALVESVFGRRGRPLKALLYGTPFQVKVWEALVRIPYGTLTSYAAVSRFIGQPGASRAVGNAVGSNNIALLIPCHRVIRSLGGLGGYKWGEDRKLSIIGYEKSKRDVPHGEKQE
jgi:AraC family transcriptional regulator of adaptative response/methylated-DNA-[protein]-cysteine methyltransferase